MCEFSGDGFGSLVWNVLPFSKTLNAMDYEMKSIQEFFREFQPKEFFDGRKFLGDKQKIFHAFVGTHQPLPNFINKPENSFELLRIENQSFSGYKIAVCTN